MFETAMILGVIFLVVGLGMLSNPQQYTSMVKDFMKNSALIYIGALMSLLFGLLILSVNHVITLDMPGLIALFGWMALLKGILLSWCPSSMVKFSEKIMKKRNVMVYASVFYSILGILMLNFAYTIS